VADGVTTLNSRLMNFSKMVMLRVYFEGGRYERYQRLVVLQGSRAQLPFYAYNWSMGTARAFSTTRYRLLVDGTERAAVDIAAGATSGEFDLDLTNLTEGWHEFEIACAADETNPPIHAYVQRGSAPVNGTAMPVMSGTYGLTHEYNGRHFWGTVPARYYPTVVNLQPRETPAFSTALPRTGLVQTQLSPARPFDVFRPSVNAHGLMSTVNTQAYFWSDFTAAKPRVPLLDGPRGAGSVVMPTHIQVGRRGTYFCDPWRLAFVSAHGAVKTLAGYRHRNPPSMYNGVQDLELVGDWSAIPADRRGFHELWGMAWDERTLTTDPTAAPINGEQPHVHGPRAFLADTQNNRICALTFSPVSHEVPPRVTEFITGLADPWDVVCRDGVLYVSERKTHRIVAYDATSGAQLRVVVSGADLSGVDSNRFVFRRTTLDRVRQEACVGPEGLYLLDDWLYYGSRAMEQVKRVNLSTGAIEVVANVHMDGNSTYAKIAVSDGTYGPRGTVFVAHWSNNYFGYPHAYLPGGTQWDYIMGSGEKGTPFSWSSYPTGVGVGSGRMIFGSASESLLMMSRALPTDVALDRNLYIAGQRDYEQRGFPLLYGPAGWGYYGLPLPWGVSAAIDYYLRAHGHTPV
jgi:hypothetical protein